MVSRSIVINHKLCDDYQLIIMALNPSTLSKWRDMNVIKFLYGLVSGIIDSPFRLLFRLGFRIPGITRSRDPYLLAPMTRNCLTTLLGKICLLLKSIKL